MRACWLKWVGRDWSISADYIWLNYSGANTFDVLLPTAAFLLLIPSIDETIQLFVPGRAGMITDVMIDYCGAATGVVLRYLLRSLICAKKAA